MLTLQKNRLTLCGLFVLCFCLCTVAYGRINIAIIDVTKTKRNDHQLHDVKVKVERIGDREYFRVDLQIGKTGVKEFQLAKLTVQENGNPVLSLPLQTTKDDRGVHVWFFLTHALAAKSSLMLYFENLEEGVNIFDNPTVIYKVNLLSYLPKERQKKVQDR